MSAMHGNLSCMTPCFLHDASLKGLKPCWCATFSNIACGEIRPCHRSAFVLALSSGGTLWIATTPLRVHLGMHMCGSLM